jgi:hypothetical protein
MIHPDAHSTIWFHHPKPPTSVDVMACDDQSPPRSSLLPIRSSYGGEAKPPWGCQITPFDPIQVCLVVKAGRWVQPFMSGVSVGRGSPLVPSPTPTSQDQSDRRRLRCLIARQPKSSLRRPVRETFNLPDPITLHQFDGGRGQLAGSGVA